MSVPETLNGAVEVAASPPSEAHLVIKEMEGTSRVVFLLN